MREDPAVEKWFCPKCWHEVYSATMPEPRKEYDSHTCEYISLDDVKETLNFDDIISFESLYALLPKEERSHELQVKLREAYDHELEMMVKYSASAHKPSIHLVKFRTAGSQYIAEFWVNDHQKEHDPQRVNWHLQNTSQWVYAGCILVQNGKVSCHH